MRESLGLFILLWDRFWSGPPDQIMFTLLVLPAYFALLGAVLGRLFKEAEYFD